MRHGCAGIIIQGVGIHRHIIVLQTHLVIEHSLAGLGVVLSPVGCQRTALVDKLTSVKEIRYAIHTVIVERVAEKLRLTMCENHIPTSLCTVVVTVIPSPLRFQREGIALFHKNVSESLEAIALLIEICAIASKDTTLMTELHLSSRYLNIRAQAIDVVFQLVGMLKIHAGIFLLGTCTLTARLGREDHTQAKKAQDHQHDGSVPVYICFVASRHHFIQPSYSKLQFL